MPGFGDRVGQPQRPHHHPDDASHGHDHNHHDQADLHD
jgi:sirohydrochlorin cobaltochelatase